MDIYLVYVIFNKSGEERDYVLKHAFSNGRFGIRMKLRSTSHLLIEIRIYSKGKGNQRAWKWAVHGKHP
jgi:hypothetical protein